MNQFVTRTEIGVDALKMNIWTGISMGIGMGIGLSIVGLALITVVGKKFR